MKQVFFSFLFLAALAVMTACTAPASMRRPPSPEDLTARAVHHRLRTDPVTESYAFRVRVDGDIVTLRGSVPDAGTRARAAAITRSVPGVLGVVDELQP